MRAMFDAHRPPVRPGQPGHDVPDGRRLAAADGADAGPARRVGGARPRLRHRRPVPRARRPRPAAGRARPVVRDAGRRPHRPPRWSRPTCCGCPCRDGVGRRRDVRVRPAQPRRPGAVLRRAGPGRAAGRAHRACSRWPSRPTRSCGRPRGVLRQGRAPHRRRCCRTRAAYRYLPRSVAYLPAAGRAAGELGGGRLRRRRRDDCCRAASPSFSSATRDR